MPKWFIFLFLSASLQAEEMPSFGLGDLVYYSTCIFTAKPLAEAKYVINTREGGYELQRFVIQNVIKQDTTALPDTIAIEVSNYEFEATEFPEYIFYGQYYPPIYPHHPRVFYPVPSGIRPFRGSTAFVPHQHDNPGGYYLHAAPDQTLDDWVFQTQKIMNRFDALLALRRIESLEAQNSALFEWIDQHHSCWKRDTVIVYRPFNACDWGQYEYEVFQWINGNGIWQDAWKSIQLSGLLSRYEYGTILTQPENTPIAFACTEGRAFLMEQISKDIKPAISIQLLSEAIWSWNENLLSLATEAERYRAMQLVLPLLEVQETQYGVLYFIRAAAFHPDFPWKDKDGVSPLAALKKVYKTTTDEHLKRGLEGLIGEIERK
jgi:hypothetical protein